MTSTDGTLTGTKFFMLYSTVVLEHDPSHCTAVSPTRVGLLPWTTTPTKFSITSSFGLNVKRASRQIIKARDGTPTRGTNDVKSFARSAVNLLHLAPSNASIIADRLEFAHTCDVNWARFCLISDCGVLLCDCAATIPPYSWLRQSLLILTISCGFVGATSGFGQVQTEQ